MRRTNSFTLETDNFGTLEVKVFEVRPMDVIKIHQSAGPKEGEVGGLQLGEYERLLPLCTNLTKEQLLSLYPNEFAQVLESFKEVNSDFLAPWPTIKSAIEKVGLLDWLIDLLDKSGMVEQLKMTLSLDLRKLAVSSPKGDTLNPNDTDGGISASASDTPSV